MRISRIELSNFGSYAGKNVFDIGNSVEHNIVLIGGKNGAGKTTLFSGIKLCLYGHRAYGFQGINSFYRRSVKKYFNDISKYESESYCYVNLDFYLSNGQTEDKYEIKREWNIYASTLAEFENVIVKKNEKSLNEEEIADFDNFLMNLIPPELFNLFFFDGEQIADYFLEDNSNQHLKNAFMMLCGFDTLDIMEKNFKRVIYGKKTNKTESTEYFVAKDKVNELNEKINILSLELEQIGSKLESTDLEIRTLEKKYKLQGGVSYEEWNQLVLNLKGEEAFRENTKLYLKKMANDVIPFVIVKPLLIKLKRQITMESEKQQFEILQKSLKNMLPDVMARVYDRLEWKDDEELTRYVLEEFDNEANKRHVNDVNYILNLSSKEFAKIQVLIDRYLSFNRQEIIDAELDIKKSLKRTQQLRTQMERSNIDGLQEFAKAKGALLESKNHDIEKQQKALSELSFVKQELLEAESALKREEKKFEEQIKNKSVNDLAERSIAFLEKLQGKLYSNEVRKVEKLFMSKIKQLARKNNFIDMMNIDDEFNIHVYKKVIFNAQNTCKKILEKGYTNYIEEYGLTHCKGLLEATNVESIEMFIEKFQNVDKSFTVLQEVDKSRLSKGEKQIFIMALYWAFMCLSKYEVPFIIDTPFARIDSEHRANITKDFFMDLQGQVFIFSTNEEIVGEHYEVMKNDVQSTFLLENIDNLKTNVRTNIYFGGEESAI